jgi:hypothetical protein
LHSIQDAKPGQKRTIFVYYSDSKKKLKIETLSTIQYTTIFDCSYKTYQRALTNPEAEEEVFDRKKGAPPMFPPHLVPELIVWVKKQTTEGFPPSREQFTTKAQDMLVGAGVPTVLSKYWIDSFMRSNDCPFVGISAAPIDEDRYNVSNKEISKWFDVLTEIKTTSIHPNLIINIDETGFG